MSNYYHHVDDVVRDISLCLCVLHFPMNFGLFCKFSEEGIIGYSHPSMSNYYHHVDDVVPIISLCLCVLHFPMNFGLF